MSGSAKALSSVLTLFVFALVPLMEVHRAKVDSWPKAKQRDYLINLGALKPNDVLNWPKIDHVPPGPRK